MSWFCSVCEKSFSRKDNMQRHVMSKHRNAGLTPFQTVPMFSQKCQRFRFEHPFTSMIAGMTGSGKTAWVRSLLQQASETIYPPPERIVWCYSQWQPAYTEMLVAMRHIEFVKGIPTALEQDSYFDVNKRNLIVFDDQMIDASKDKRIVNLSQKPDKGSLTPPPLLNPAFLTPPPTVETPSQQGPKPRRRVNYLDDHKTHAKQLRKRRHKKFKRYKYSVGEEG